MITYKKHAVSVALVILFAASLLVPVPTTSAVFRQSITDIKAPGAVDPGESFPVSVTVRYDFTGEGEVGIFSRIRDPSTGSGVAIASGGYRLVHGVGDVTWDFQIVATNAAGLWRLEAYVFHYVDHQEPEDDRRGFTVTVGEPTAGFDFALRFDPSVVAIRQGQYALADVSVGIVSGQPPEVTLMYTIPPVPGISASLSKTKGIPLFKSTLRIETTTQTPPGTYTINVAGVAGTVTRAASLTVKVESAQPPRFDFDIRVEPTIVFLKPGQSAPCEISVGRVTGTPQEVSLTYTIPPVIGISASLSHTKAMPPFDSTLTISTTTQTPAGTYTINVVGISGSLQRTVRMTLTVTAAGVSGEFDFSITVSPESQSLTPEGSAVYDVYVDLEAGTSDTVSLTVSGLPEDATFAFDPPTENPYFQSRLTIYIPEFTAAGAPMPAGTYTLEVTGEGGGLVRTTTATLVVEAAVVVTTQLPQTTMQATVTSKSTSVATTQVATHTAGGLGGGAIFLLLLIVVVVAGAAYYVGRRRKTKPESVP